MRNIKFRGKNLRDKWVYGNLYIIKDRCFISDMGTLVNLKWTEVDPETVGQYIGIEDNTGEELYEGMTITPTPWTTKNSIIIYRKGAFAFKEIDEPYHAPYSLGETFGGCRYLKIIHDSKEG